MRSLRPGAQRASLRPTIVAAVVATVLASLFAFAPSPGVERAVAATTAPWYDVEVYYLRLLNCTRTGGWVRSDGSCAAYGSGKYSKYVPPLKLSAGISDVARKWARNLAVNVQCKHGDPGARLRRAGYTSWRWGENIGCGDGYRSAYRSVLDSHRYFQAEKSYGGGHWRNIKNSMFKRVGIGVWKDHGHVRLVTDFYSW